MEETREEKYIAHIRRSDGARQGVFEHCKNVAALAEEAGKEYGIGSLSGLSSHTHDCGKNTDDFQTYLENASAGQKVVRGSVIHSTHGGLIISSLGEGEKRTAQLCAEICRSAVFSHHGLRDCITKEGKYSVLDAKERIASSYEGVRDITIHHMGYENLKSKFNSAERETSELLKKINEFQKQQFNPRKEVPLFNISMYTRLLTSILIDADRSDTAGFEDNLPPEVPQSFDERKKTWAKLLKNCEDSVDELQSKAENSLLNQYRREISSACRSFDGGENGIFRLVVPCGAGKTLSSLRYALKTAEKYSKRHIFYIAPFNSILEQNSEEIRKYVGDTAAVLEHHSNIVFDAEDGLEEEKKYKSLTENWTRSPIIATTAVQFLNTLFDGKSSSVRRMQALGNSIIILDEIQALPLKTLCLFNLAMNFLAYFCNSSIVACSATQPLLEELKFPLCKPQSIISDEEKYAEAFRRVEILDCCGGNGMSFKEAADFALEQSKNVSSQLVIVNTKRCARELFSELCKMTEGGETEYRLFHLSTNMCPAHRIKVLKKLKLDLEDKKRSYKIICISTSLIEAGVDISFERVIRSLSGLDSIVQAAGRCNRNREWDFGVVQVIFIGEEAVDNVGNLKSAQTATREVFNCIRNCPKDYPAGALSKGAMDKYYALYFNPNMKETSFPLDYDPEHTIIDLLTTNPVGTKKFKGKAENKGVEEPIMHQAFKEAGEAFAVIEDKGMLDTLVELEAAKPIIARLQAAQTKSEKRSALRQLQQYTIRISNSTRNKLGEALRFDSENGVYILSEDFYHPQFGVSETRVTAPKLLEF
ncbi:MAG: CRISPR-associated helicase Cas3' [Oscillospiraceae bacterium]